jgi:hypothetical protein
LNINALAVKVEDISPQDCVFPDNFRRRDQFRQGFPVRFAIIVHQPHVRTGKRQSGPHSGVKPTGSAGVFFQLDQMKGRITTGNLRGEQLTRRLLGSIVDDHKVIGRISLRVDRGKTSLEQRRTVPCDDDCGDSYHKGVLDLLKRRNYSTPIRL